MAVRNKARNKMYNLCNGNLLLSLLDVCTDTIDIDSQYTIGCTNQTNVYSACKGFVYRRGTTLVFPSLSFHYLTSFHTVLFYMLQGDCPSVMSK